MQWKLAYIIAKIAYSFNTKGTKYEHIHAVTRYIQFNRLV